MTERSHDIDVLNGLIETTLDSCDGYSEAADHAQDPIIEDIFKRWAAERRRVVADLRTAVRELGGKPEEDGTVLASAHRVFLDMRAYLSGNDSPLVQEVERGEEHIKNKFEDALKDDELSESTRKVVEAAFASVSRGRDDMHELKKTYEKT